MPESPFQRHDRVFEDFQYCYPVISRRSYGLSIGINLSLRKECNFDCPYCQIDRTAEARRSQFIDLTILEKELLTLISSALSGELFTHERFKGTDEYYKVLRDVALSGDGEPTTSKYFDSVSEIALRVIGEYRDREILIKPVVITNGSMLHKPEIKRTLYRMSELDGGPWVKLDASNPTEFKRVAETKIPFEKILENILQYSKEKSTVLQTILYKYPDETESFEPESMLNLLRNFLERGAKFEYLQLYTLARSTKIKDLKPVSKTRLEDVAILLREGTGIKIGVYP